MTCDDGKEEEGISSARKTRVLILSCIGRPCQRCIKRSIGHLCHDEPKHTSNGQSNSNQGKARPSNSGSNNTNNTNASTNGSTYGLPSGLSQSGGKVKQTWADRSLLSTHLFQSQPWGQIVTLVVFLCNSSVRWVQGNLHLPVNTWGMRSL